MRTQNDNVKFFRKVGKAKSKELSTKTKTKMKGVANECNTKTSKASG